MPIAVIVVLPDGRVARLIRLTTLGATRDLTLSVDAIVTELITVTGATPTIDAAPGAATTLITGADLQLRHPLTISQVLDIVPGVSSISEGQSAVPAIRGLARGRTLVLVTEGARQRSGAPVRTRRFSIRRDRTIEIALVPGSSPMDRRVRGCHRRPHSQAGLSARMHARLTERSPRELRTER